MQNSRETGYVCAYWTSSGEGRTWVRAWTPEQARELVRALLRDDGVEGEVAVRVTAEPGPARGAKAATRRPAIPRA